MYYSNNTTNKNFKCILKKSKFLTKKFVKSNILDYFILYLYLDEINFHFINI